MKDDPARTDPSAVAAEALSLQIRLLEAEIANGQRTTFPPDNNRRQQPRNREADAVQRANLLRLIQEALRIIEQDEDFQDSSSSNQRRERRGGGGGSEGNGRESS